MIPRFDEQEIEAVTQVIRNGELSPFFKDFLGGVNCQAFEREFASYLGIKYAISVCNGTVSLEIALKALGIKQGDDVIVPAMSFIATATAVLSVGARPIFVDVDPTTLNINPSQIEEAITSKTKAILPVSLLGYPADMETISKIADNFDLFVLEDAAQALSAEIDGKKIGTWGKIGSFSFQQTKSLTTAGEGGAIVTNDDQIADKCRNIRNHGNAYGSLSDVVCTNSRLTEIQATFGRVQLQKLDNFNRIQIENANYFLSHIKYPLTRLYDFPIPENLKCTYLLIPTILLKEAKMTRDELVGTLKAQGISQDRPGQNVGYYKKLLYEYPIFQNGVEYRLASAEWARDNIILFDIHRWHTLDEVKSYVEIINKILA